MHGDSLLVILESPSSIRLGAPTITRNSRDDVLAALHVLM